MANITTDTILDQITISNNEAINVTNGAKLYIRKSNTTTSAPGVITVSDGEIIIDPTLEGGVAPITFYTFGTSGRFIIEKNGKLTARGGWASIGTSNGNANQWFNLTYPNPHQMPFVQVETGNNTNTYVEFLNQGTTNTFIGGNDTGPGWDLGRFFQTRLEFGSYTNKTFFGDGTNGMIPPSGARIRTPNILITTSEGTQSTTKSYIEVRNGGSLDMENCMLSERYYLTSSYASGIRMVNCGSTNANIINAASVYIDGLHITRDNQSLGAGGILFLVDIQNPTINNLSILRKINTNNYQGGALNISGSNLIIDNANIFSSDLHNQGENYNMTLTQSDVTFNNLLFVGGWARMYEGVFKFNNTRYSQGYVSQGTNADTRIFLFERSCSGSRVDGLTLCSNGFRPRYVPVEARSSTDIVVKGIDFTDSGLMSIGYRLSNSTIVGADSNLGTLSLSYIVQASPSLGVSLIDVSTANALSTIFSSNNTGRYYTDIKNVTASAITPAKVGYIGSAWQIIKDTNNTTGKIGFTASPPSTVNYFEVVSGSPFFEKDTRLFLKTTGDSCILTCPYRIMGISSFIDSLPTITADGDITSANCEVSVQEEGGEWSNWYTLDASGVNDLSGLTFDKNAGLYFKLKVTATTTNANNALRTIAIPANIDGTVKYPLSLVSLTLQNMITGSNYRVHQNSNGKVLAFGNATSSDVTISGIEYLQNEPITIRVRKAGYLPYETGGVLTSTGSTTWVSQVEDPLY
jgi:hypothetical protein